MPLDRSLKRWEIALMAGVLCALLCGFWLGEEQTQLADRVIRFHVIANSDSPEDQALKLQVRDAVLSATEEFYPQEASLEEARAQIDWGLAQCDVLKIADNELLFMTGQSDFEKGAAILQKQYPNIRLMNVTAGAQGSYSFCGDVHTFQPGCTLGGVIETTGAGDTFCASVLNFVLEHGIEGLTRPYLAQMLRFANAAAYLVTTKKGAIRSMPAREQVEDVLRRM